MHYILLGNREHALAVFLCAAMLFTACGSKESKDAEIFSIEDADVYTLEVRKDRLEKDKYFLTSHNTPIRASDMGNFRSLAYYPVDKSYALYVSLDRLESPEQTLIATTRDKIREMLYIGDFVFTLHGEHCSLRVFAPKDTSDGYYWFIPFTDLTNGSDTYGGGRYIDIDDTSSDSTFLDFNYAYNPYCAYNELYDCPIPPAENALPVAVRAGEKNYPLKHAY